MNNLDKQQAEVVWVNQPFHHQDDGDGGGDDDGNCEDEGDDHDNNRYNTFVAA